MLAKKKKIQGIIHFIFSNKHLMSGKSRQTEIKPSACRREENTDIKLKKKESGRR